MSQSLHSEQFAVQVSGLHLCRDIGVAVPVTPHPRPKGEGGGPNRQLLACVLLQGRIQLAHVGWDGCPKGLLHYVQTTTSLCSSNMSSSA